MSYLRPFRPSGRAAVILILAVLASTLVSHNRLPADGSGLSKISLHPKPDHLLADTQQRLQADVARQMQMLHAEATRRFLQSPGNGLERIVLPRVDPRTSLLTLAADPWPLPSWSERELAGDTKPAGSEDLTVLYHDSERDFGRIAPTGQRKAQAWQIKSLDLVGLVKHDHPVAYVTTRIQMNKLKETPTRDLDFFEATGVEQLKKGENLYARSQDGVIRMLGAIRAQTSCLSCHLVEEGTLLGAFSYTVRPANLHWTPKQQAARLQQITLAKAALVEQSKRDGPESVAALARAAGKGSDEMRSYARSLLDDHLYRQPVQVLKSSLRDSDAEVRQSAARVFPTKQPDMVRDLTDDLIRLVSDSEPEVREAARQALVKVSNGENFGPAVGTDSAAIADAEKRWRAWWATKSRASRQ
jgi:hypothetical protein